MRAAARFGKQSLCRRDKGRDQSVDAGTILFTTYSLSTARNIGHYAATAVHRQRSPNWRDGPDAAAKHIAARPRDFVQFRLIQLVVSKEVVVLQAFVSAAADFHRHVVEGVGDALHLQQRMPGAQLERFGGLRVGGAR